MCFKAVDLEPSSSATIFHTDYKKHGDLREMLDSSKDSLKLDAMKRIISMVAKGRDVSDLFPAVVKNVASKNIEVKKLVYVYLTRYAEEQQNSALLSIATFQTALKDPNQLIREEPEMNEEKIAVLEKLLANRTILWLLDLQCLNCEGPKHENGGPKDRAKSCTVFGGKCS